MEHAAPRKARRPYRQRAVYLKWGSLLLGMVLVFVFFAFFADRFQSTTLEVSLGKDRTIKVETQSLRSTPGELARVDPARHFIDSARGFYFTLPDRNTWSKPETFSGVDGIIKASGVTLAPGFSAMMKLTAGANPFYESLQAAHLIQVVSGSPIKIEFTDETSTEQMASLFKRMKRVAEQQGQPWDPKEMQGLLRTSGLFTAIEFSNAFSVMVLDKSTFAESGRPATLPNFFAVFSEGLSAGNVDKLVADESSILMGTSVLIKHAKLNGRDADVELDRWLLFIQGQSRFYLGEITYSPQSNAPIRVWEDLRQLIGSLRILDS